MKKALKNLQNKGRLSDDIHVRTTHLYLKFSPQNEEELDLIRKKNNLDFYDYPLDYEMEEGGLFYHDPAIPEDQPTYQYVAIEVDEEDLPAVNYEVLAELYLPEEDDKINGRTTGNALADALENEALRITNNLEETSKETNSSTSRRSSYTPAGRVRVWDDVITTTSSIAILDHYEYYPCDGGGENPKLLKKIRPPSDQCRRAIYRYETRTSNGAYIPLQGVKARSWFKTRTGWTNAQGYYTCSGSFKDKVNYKIKWETDDYDIRNWLFFQAYYDGPRQKGNWNPNISGREAIGHATVFRAAYRYFYLNTENMQVPIISNKLKLLFRNNAGSSGGINWGIVGTALTNIKVWGKNKDGTQNDTNEVFSTTVHEIGHTSHIQLMPFGWVNYVQVDKLLRESWCNAVEWHITRIEYNERGVANYDNPSDDWDLIDNFGADHQQWWDNTFTTTIDYTPIFIDLVDDFNQDTGPFDHVTGYTMQGIESTILTDSYGLTSLRTALKNNKPTGVSDADIDDYLEYYFNL